VTRTPKQHLARYRAWLVVNVALAVFLVLVVAPFWFASPHAPAAVFPAVGALIAWWLTFIAAWVANTRIPGGTR
jgi:hypothetical protein